MRRWLAALAAGLLGCAHASAGEITVLSGGAIEPGLHSAAQAFERDTGHRVSIRFNTTPQIVERLARGETFDVVIAPPQALDGPGAQARLGTPRMPVGRVGLGVAVRADAPLPDLASVDGLKRSISEADSLVFNRASTGIYFENLLKRWSLFDAVQPKTTRYADGASVLEHVIKGSGREIAFAAITEIRLYAGKGLRYVGPLPAEVQNYTAYVAVPMNTAADMSLARSFVDYLGSAAGKRRFVEAGIE